MLVTSISPRGAFPKFNLTFLATSAEAIKQPITYPLIPPLDWLQIQQNNGALPIRTYVDKSSNIYTNDPKLYLEYLKHCIGISPMRAVAGGY